MNEQLSKERELVDKILNEYLCSDETDIPKMESWLKDYAKDNGIAFLKFVDEGYSPDSVNFDMYWDDNGGQFTMKQLYELYLKSIV